MPNGNWSRGKKLALAGILVGALGLIVWFGMPVERMRDQQQSYETPRPVNPTTQKMTTQKQPQAKTKARSDPSVFSGSVSRVGEAGVSAPLNACQVEPTCSEELVESWLGLVGFFRI